MKTGSKFLLLVMVLLTAVSCTEDVGLESIERAARIDHNLVGLYDGSDFKLVYSEELDKRALEIQFMIAQEMKQEHELLMIAGADILRNRGIDPATAFSEGLDDPRLARVALLINVIDSIGYEYYKQGLVIESVYPIGPYNEIVVSNGSSISVSQNTEIDMDDIYDCIGDEGARAGVVFGSIMAVAGWSGVGGAIVVGIIGSTTLTVTGAIGVVGAFYMAHKVRKCLNAKERAKITCSVTKKVDIDCVELVMNGREKAGIWGGECEGRFCKTVYDGCLDKINNLVLDKMAGLELQLGDTLAYALELNRE